ncbi:hypothetical protein SORBI_3003G438800 [Sorghum bicolor]|uniref:Uncharacterized protein n=1 Tax=Sorghum bicolor TaxID=4558 RepID=A0A1B6Q8F1_SORBI|nr:hypothetical protein SORBI_3003G438800 [Sorghum bicolor]
MERRWSALVVNLNLHLLPVYTSMTRDSRDKRPQAQPPQQPSSRVLAKSPPPPRLPPPPLPFPTVLQIPQTSRRARANEPPGRGEARPPRPPLCSPGPPRGGDPHRTSHRFRRFLDRVLLRGIFPLPFAVRQIDPESFFLGSTGALAMHAEGWAACFRFPQQFGTRRKRTKSPSHALLV